MRKIRNILIGWGKRIGILKTTGADRRLAKKRMAICKECPMAKQSKILKIIQGQGVYENELYCSKCSCPLLEKTIVKEEKCPIGKW